MTEENKCSRCGGTNLTPGFVQSTGKVAFHATDAKFLALGTTRIPVEANMCLDCGCVELVGDVQKARSLVGAS
jgi:hypothetical protein